MRFVLLALLVGCGAVPGPSKGEPQGGDLGGFEIPLGDDDAADADVHGDNDTAADSDSNTDTDIQGGDEGAGDDDTAGGDDDEPCPAGAACNPIVIDAFPFEHDGDTTQGVSDTIDSYACSPATGENGPEIFYALDTPTLGFVRIEIEDEAGVDVDVHWLDDTSQDSCRARNNIFVQGMVEAGRTYVVIDSWTNSGGTEFPGAYTLRVTFLPLGEGDCAVSPVDQRMYWTGCAEGIDCYTQGENVYLRTPAFGPVVREAHLVTVEDDFDGGWPETISEGLAAHYALSQAATGYDMDRDDVWCPQEGGSEFGQGAGGGPVPVIEESWYVNMYWRPRPPKGTRLLAVNPDNGRAVVVAGGYETGPGSNTAIGGVSEETHHYLGTGHRDPFILGFLIDDELPYGPIDCGFE